MPKNGEIKMEEKSIRLYGHLTCPGVPPIRAMLQTVGAEYEYIDIHKDLLARQRVRDINNGYESVPTLEFPDGTTLTEPNTSELKQKLESMGYRIPLTALIAGNVGQIFIGVAVLIALLRAFGVF